MITIASPRRTSTDSTRARGGACRRSAGDGSVAFKAHRYHRYAFSRRAKRSRVRTRLLSRRPCLFRRRLLQDRQPRLEAKNRDHEGSGVRHDAGKVTYDIFLLSLILAWSLLLFTTLSSGRLAVR